MIARTKEAAVAKTKLTLSVEQHVIERAKRYSRRNDTTVSELVSQFLASLEEMDGASTPITARLIGAFGSEGSVDEYFKYLDEKYG